MSVIGRRVNRNTGLPAREGLAYGDVESIPMKDKMVEVYNEILNFSDNRKKQSPVPPKPLTYITDKNMVYNVNNIDKFVAAFFSMITGPRMEPDFILKVFEVLLRSSKVFVDRLIAYIYYIKNNKKTAAATAGNVGNIYYMDYDKGVNTPSTPAKHFKILAFDQQSYGGKTIIVADNFIVKETQPIDVKSAGFNVALNALGETYVTITDPLFEVFASTMMNILYDEGSLMNINRFYGIFAEGSTRMRSPTASNRSLKYYVMSSSATIEFGEFIREMDQNDGLYYENFMYISIFQILYACFLGKKKLGYLHQDLHSRNVMFSYVNDRFINLVNLTKPALRNKLTQYYHSKNVADVKFLRYKFTDEQGGKYQVVLENTGLIAKLIDFGRGTFYLKNGEYVAPLANNDQDIKQITYEFVDEQYYSTYDNNAFLLNLLNVILYRYEEEREQMHANKPEVAYDEFTKYMDEHCRDYYDEPSMTKILNSEYYPFKDELMNRVEYEDGNGFFVTTEFPSKTGYPLTAADRNILKTLTTLLKLNFDRVEVLHEDIVISSLTGEEITASIKYKNLDDLHFTPEPYIHQGHKNPIMRYYSAEGNAAGAGCSDLPTIFAHMKGFLYLAARRSTNNKFYYITLDGQEPNLDRLDPSEILTFDADEQSPNGKSNLKNYLYQLGKYIYSGCDGSNDKVEPCLGIKKELDKFNPDDIVEDNTFIDEHIDSMNGTGVMGNTQLEKYIIYTGKIFNMYRIETNLDVTSRLNEEYFFPVVYNLFLIKNYDYITYKKIDDYGEGMLDYLAVSIGNYHPSEAKKRVTRSITAASSSSLATNELVTAGVKISNGNHFNVYFNGLYYSFFNKGGQFNISVNKMIKEEMEYSFYCIPLFIKDSGHTKNDSFNQLYSEMKGRGGKVMVNIMFFCIGKGLFFLSIEDETESRDFWKLQDFIKVQFQPIIIFALDISSNNAQMSYKEENKVRYLYPSPLKGTPTNDLILYNGNPIATSPSQGAFSTKFTKEFLDAFQQQGGPIVNIK